MGVKRVTVHIQRLVLRGFQYADRLAIAAGLQAELARRLELSDVAGQIASRGDAAHLHVGPVPAAENSGPRQLGVAIARQISEALTR